MILFLWSIVAGAAGYLKRRRLEQWMKEVTVNAYSTGKRLVLRRTSITSLADNRPWERSHVTTVNNQNPVSLLWQCNGSEVLLHETIVPLQPDWFHILDDLSPVDQSSDVIYFTAGSQIWDDSSAGPSDQSNNVFGIENICTPLAWRSDEGQITTVFACSINEFVSVACAWIYGRAVFKDTFEVHEITTELLSPQFLQLISLERTTHPTSPPASSKCNGSISNYYHDTSTTAPITKAVTAVSFPITAGCCSRSVEAITTTVNNGEGQWISEDNERRGPSRSSVLCSLEQLCLSDILAAKNLCQSLVTFQGELPTVDSEGEASVYYTCNREFTSREMMNADGGSLSLENSQGTTPIQEQIQNVRKSGINGQAEALTPLSVDIYSGVSSDYLSMSVDHLSPCHGFNDRLLDRRWYSTWRCDSVNSSATGGGVAWRQTVASLPSRSSSSSKRRRVKSGAKTESDAAQIQSTSRRWSLPSPSQQRARSSSSGRSKFRPAPSVKPPNVLIYAGDEEDPHQLYSRLATVIGSSVHPEKYTVSRLRRSRFLLDPWPSNSICVILADTSGLEDRCWQRLFDYFKSGGRMFFVCENRLLASLNDVGSAKKRYGLLKLVFDTNQQSRNQKDLKEFLKRLSKALKKPSVCEHFNVLAGDGRPKYTLSFVREESTPLILYMQNSQDRAVALFSDMTIEAVLTAGRSLIREILQRLGLDLAPFSTTPTLSCGYLVFENERTKADQSDTFLSLSRIDDAKTSIEFFDDRVVPRDRVTPTRVYLPVWVNADDRDVGFDTTDYFNHLKTERLGRCVLYVPVATSTMNYFEGLLARLPDKYDVVAIANCQLEGQGRGGTRFLSPEGCAMFTIGLRVPSHCRLAQSPGYVQHLLALAAVDAICGYKKDMANFHLRLKWPNDIYYGVGRMVKVGGVLVNCLARSDTLFFIAGLGLNISNRNPSVCINDLLSPEMDPFRTAQVAALVLNRFEALIDQFEHRGHDGILPLYYKYWLHNYQEVTLAETGERVMIRGLDKRGYLEVRSRHTGRVFSLQPDGNTLDMMHNLIKIKE